MVGKLKLAYVNFFREKRGRKVVKISKIVGFAPKTHTDFDEDATYSIKWPHFPNEGSFSTESEFDAKIICLGVDRQDLENEAAQKGLRIPSLCFSDDKSDTSTKIIVQELFDKEPETSAKRAVKCLRKSSKGKEGKGKEGKGKEEKGKEEKGKEEKGKEEKGKEGKGKEEKGKEEKGKGSTKSGRKTIIVSQNPPLVYQTPSSHKNPNDYLTEDEPDFIPGARLRNKKLNKTEEVMFERMRDTNASHSLKSEKEVSDGDDYDLRLQETMPVSDFEPDHLVDALTLGNVPVKVDFKRTQKRRLSESSTSISSTSWVSNKSEGRNNFETELYVNKILRIETELKQIKRENFELQQKLSSSEEQVKDLMNLNFQLQKKIANARYADKQRSPSPCNLDLEQAADSDEPRAVKRKLYSSEDQMVAKYSSPRKSTSGSAKEVTPRKSTPGSAQKSTPGSAQKSTPGSAQKSTPGSVQKSTPGSVQKSTPGSTKSTPGSIKSSPGSTKSTPGSSNYASNLELAPMIRDALTGKTPLQSDGAGKVHIGNNVWLKQSVFNDKLAKNKTEPTIALRDAMTSLYSTQEMAERSLDGGVPVRGDKTKKKMKMTPHKREALLGLYRAKAMLKSTDEAYLDLAIKKGKATMRDRLNEAQKSLNKPKNPAEDQ